MGVFTLLLTTYFVVNSNNNPQVNAGGVDSAYGILIPDPMHEFDCNINAKADYVLQSIDDGACIPVSARRNLVNKYVGREVGLSGSFANGKLFATGLLRMPKALPTPVYLDDPKY